MTAPIRHRAIPAHPLRFEQVRIENTDHCGYSCFFCPREQLTRPRGFMSLEDLELVLFRVGVHDGRVDLHGFGEPLLDRLLPAKVALVRERWPRSQPTLYSTLGVPVTAGYLGDLVSAGLSHVEVSFYGADRDSYACAHGVDRFDTARANLETLAHLARIHPSLKVVVRAFPAHDTVKPPESSDKARQGLLDWMESLGLETFRERALHNYGSGRAYNPPGAKAPCSVTWGLRSRILQVTWDLDVIPCCFDFNAEVKLGNLRHQTLAEVFGGAAYRKFFEAHLTDRLEEYPICLGCERCREP